MTYEYEKENISKINHFNIVTASSNVSKPSEELQEVYRKAKAFDKVLELHSQHIDTSSIYGSDLPLSANRYEYYDDGLFAYEMYTLIENYLEDK